MPPHTYTFVNDIADVLSLRQEDGSFVGDEWKEVDTRYIRAVSLDERTK
jgi:prenyltransferase beta subunit